MFGFEASGPNQDHYWGILSVLGRADISDPVKSSRSRAVRRGLRDTYLKDPEFVMEEGIMAKVKAICEITKEVVLAAPKKKARTS